MNSHCLPRAARAALPVAPRLISLLVLLLVLSAGIERVQAQVPETVCLQCHGKQPGHLGAPVAAWRTSVHSANGISCHNCHGGDPSDPAMAMTPERGFLGAPKDTAIPGFCGRCHVGVKDDYLASAHGRALGRGGPQCVTCHGNHAVQRATLDLINQKECTRCHDYGRADVIRSAMAETDLMISNTERALAALHRSGIVTKDMEGELFALRNRFHRLFHSVDVEKVRSQTAGVRTDLTKIRKRVAAIEGELQRRRSLGGIVVGALVSGGLLSLFLYRSYRRESDGVRDS